MPSLKGKEWSSSKIEVRVQAADGVFQEQTTQFFARLAATWEPEQFALNAGGFRPVLMKFSLQL